MVLIFKHSHFSFFPFILSYQIAGMCQWKHGRKGSGVYWFQQAGDKVSLDRIAQQLFESIGKSVSDDSFKVLFSWMKKGFACISCMLSTKSLTALLGSYSSLGGEICSQLSPLAIFLVRN